MPHFGAIIFGLQKFRNHAKTVCAGQRGSLFVQYQQRNLRNYSMKVPLRKVHCPFFERLCDGPCRFLYPIQDACIWKGSIDFGYAYSASLLQCSIYKDKEIISSVVSLRKGFLLNKLGESSTVDSLSGWRRRRTADCMKKNLQRQSAKAKCTCKLQVFFLARP